MDIVRKTILKYLPQVHLTFTRSVLATCFSCRGPQPGTQNQNSAIWQNKPR